MAKQFQFPLEKVLDYKRKIEDLKAEELGHSKNKKKKEEENLENIERIKKDVLIGDNSREKMTLNQLNISTDYLHQLNEQIEKGENRVTEAETEIKENLNHLTEASKDKKAVEKLRERKLSEHKILEKRSERKQTDEIANRNNQNKRENKS